MASPSRRRPIASHRHGNLDEHKALEVALAAIVEHAERRYSARPQYRTWRLQGTPYVLFHRVDEAAETIFVVVAWSAMRGAGPTLP